MQCAGLSPPARGRQASTSRRGAIKTGAIVSDDIDDDDEGTAFEMSANPLAASSCLVITEGLISNKTNQSVIFVNIQFFKQDTLSLKRVL